MLKRILGFTLIEILVVMAIISIVSSVLVLSFTTNQKKEIERAANVLVQKIMLAEDEALYGHQILGLAFTPTSYQFFKKKADITDEWMPYKYVKAQTFSNNWHIRLNVQNKMVALEEKPQIIFSQNGEITPFMLYLGRKHSAPLYQVVGRHNGEVIVRAVISAA